MIWIKDGEAFQSAVIARFLYYSTGLEGVDLYISGLKKMGSFVRYSRLPIKVIKEKIRFNIPNGNFLIIHPKGKRLEEVDINKYDGFLVDFSGMIKGDMVRSLGISLLHYEAISLFSRLFLTKQNINIDLGEFDKDKVYFARKILEGIEFIDNHYIISPRLLLFCLRNFEKKYNILVDEEGVEIKLDDKVIEKVYVKFYDEKLNEIEEDFIVLDGNYLEIPVIIKNKKSKFRFYIDFDNRRVFLSNNFYISKRELLESDKTLEYLKYL